MKKQNNKIRTNSTAMVEFISENEVTAQVGEAVASLLLNPAVTWAKFVLTDDMPNGNNMRIPKEEFSNIMKTGVHMPVKMAQGEIAEGHENSKPLGVITHLKMEDFPEGSRIVALAALWGLERPADIEYIKSVMESTGEVNVSWEIAYGGWDVEDNGIRALRDTILRAVTIVGNPAYQGRTKFIAIAAKATPWSQAFIDELPDSSFLYIASGGEKDSEGKTSPRSLRMFPIKDATGLIEPARLETVLSELENSELSSETLEGVKSVVTNYLEELGQGKSARLVSFGEEQSENPETEDKLEKTLEQLRAELEEKDGKLNEALASVEELKTAAEKLTNDLEALKTEKSELETEITGLREFKDGIEAEKAKVEKLAAIKDKFIQAGIEKDEEYFASNSETLLKYSEDELDFLVQELSAFAKVAESSLTRTEIPHLTSNPKSVDVRELAKALKERKAK